MTNPLIAARDDFTASHPEARAILNGRDWGLFDTGSPGPDAPVLVLIPGTLGRGDIFWNQILALKGRARVIAVSYPASGGVADWAGDLVALLDRLKLDRVAMLGSSLGGFLAQYIAALHPDRVAHLFAANTLSDGTGLDQRPPYSSDLDAAPITELRAGFSTALEGWRKAHPDQSDLVDLLLAEVGGRILEPEMRARLNALKRAPRMPAPVLTGDRVTTIESDDDPLIPPQMRAMVRAALSPAVAYRFLWGGHFPYAIRTADYTAILETALGLPPGADWGTGPERTK
ncbi:MAG: alpha/beta hydrolase [Gemmobacter sp.]|nr:alpha/beta hydrolase [Gemmobacter sp.]